VKIAVWVERSVRRLVLHLHTSRRWSFRPYLALSGGSRLRDGATGD
jgi:hypothetical protein